MSLHNTVNVKDLPQAEEIVTGNYLLLEDETGTKIIDFKNFVVGPSNTSFYNAIVSNIKSVSAYCNSLSGVLDRYQRQAVAAVNSQFEALTGGLSQRYPSFFTKYGFISVNPNTRVGTSEFSTDLPNVETVDIQVIQTDFDFDSKAPVATFFLLLDRESVTDLNDNNFYTYTLTLSTLSSYPVNTVYRYRVLKPY